MKILIATTLWKRPELTKIVLDYYRDLQKTMDIELLCCGSEGEASRSLAAGCEWNYVECSNETLSEKHNKLFEEAKKYPHDAIMLIGSDDLVSREVIQHYMDNYTAETSAVIGFNSLHFYSAKENKLIYFKGFLGDTSHRKTMGAGRLFSKSILQRLDYKPWGLCKINTGLDTNASVILYLKNIPETEIQMPAGGMIVDIKTDTNIMSFEKVLINFENCDMKILHRKFSKQIKLISELYDRPTKGNSNSNRSSRNRLAVDSDNNVVA